MKIELSQQIFKNHQISNLMKIHPVGPGFHADRRTYMTKKSLFAILRTLLKTSKGMARDLKRLYLNWLLFLII
jgi:hypothetical protein